MTGSDNSHDGERHGTGSQPGTGGWSTGGRKDRGQRGGLPRGGGRDQRRQVPDGGQKQSDGQRSGRHGGSDHRRRYEDRASGGARSHSGESGRSEFTGQRPDQRSGGFAQRRDSADRWSKRRPAAEGRERSGEARRHYDRHHQADNGQPRRFERDGRGGSVSGARTGRPSSAEQRHGAAGERHPAGGPRLDEPAMPPDTDPRELDAAVRQDLRSIPKGLADKVAAHLVAAGNLIDEDPQQALRHARYARHRASRVAAVREANGITAYQAGEWSEAIGELRAARRMGGGPGHLALMADCERALGRPERALEISRSPEASQLDDQAAVELRIVAAGARRDLGEVDAAVVSLQIPQLDPQRQDPWSARLFYAYADNLLAADRPQEAFTWFVHAAHADDENETDAPERLDELLAELGGADEPGTGQNPGSAEKDDESEREDRDD